MAINSTTAAPSGRDRSSSSSSVVSAASSSSSRRLSSNGSSIRAGGARAHICATCGMAFNRLLHLQRHEYRHGDSRPFVCSMCPKSFTRQDSLVRHARLHMRGPAGVNKLDLPSKNIKACMKCTEASKCKRCNAVGNRGKAKKQANSAGKKSTRRAVGTAVAPTATSPLAHGSIDEASSDFLEDGSSTSSFAAQHSGRSPSLASVAASDFSSWSSAQASSFTTPSQSSGTDPVAADSPWSQWSSSASSDGFDSDLSTPVTQCFPWARPDAFGNFSAPVLAKAELTDAATTAAALATVAAAPVVPLMSSFDAHTISAGHAIEAQSDSSFFFSGAPPFAKRASMLGGWPMSAEPTALATTATAASALQQAAAAVSMLPIPAEGAMMGGQDFNHCWDATYDLANMQNVTLFDSANQDLFAQDGALLDIHFS